MISPDTEELFKLRQSSGAKELLLTFKRQPHQLVHLAMKFSMGSSLELRLSAKRVAQTIVLVNVEKKSLG